MNVSPATKAAAISDYLAGKGGYFQIALEYGINPTTKDILLFNLTLRKVNINKSSFS